MLAIVWSHDGAGYGSKERKVGERLGGSGVATVIRYLSIIYGRLLAGWKDGRIDARRQPPALLHLSCLDGLAGRKEGYLSRGFALQNQRHCLSNLSAWLSLRRQADMPSWHQCRRRDGGACIFSRLALQQAAMESAFVDLQQVAGRVGGW